MKCQKSTKQLKPLVELSPIKNQEHLEKMEKRAVDQKKRKIHNLSKHPLFRKWSDMKQRCLNKNHKSYPMYGGRGIRICNEWKNNFIMFYDWSIKNGYDKSLKIDRKDNNDNYTPENCRFITNKKNCSNTRISKIWIINGKKFNSCRDAAKFFNVSHTVIRYWCNGSKKRGRFYRKKEGCYSIKKYN